MKNLNIVGLLVIAAFVGSCTMQGGGSDNTSAINRGASEFNKISGNAVDATGAVAVPAVLWPPNHKFVAIEISNVISPDGLVPITIAITGITSDEPTASAPGAGGPKHSPDALGVGTPNAELRAERSGETNGRVYTINFTATDSVGNTTAGSVTVSVPHSQNGTAAVDDGQLFDATLIN